MNQPIDACAWRGGLNGHFVLAGTAADSVNSQSERVLASISDYQSACADGAFASPQIQGLAAAFMVVCSLYSYGSDKRSSIDIDAACHASLKELCLIDLSCGPAQVCLQRLCACFDGHNMMLRADEMMARLLMECRRLFQESINLHQRMVVYVQQLVADHGPITALQCSGPRMHPGIAETLNTALGSPSSQPTGCLLIPRAVSRQGQVLVAAGLDLQTYPQRHVLLSDFALVAQLPTASELAAALVPTQLLELADISSLITANGVILCSEAQDVSQAIAQHIGYNDGFSLV